MHSAARAGSAEAVRNTPFPGAGRALTECPAGVWARPVEHVRGTRPALRRIPRDFKSLLRARTSAVSSAAGELPGPELAPDPPLTARYTAFQYPRTMFTEGRRWRT